MSKAQNNKCIFLVTQIQHISDVPGWKKIIEGKRIICLQEWCSRWIVTTMAKVSGELNTGDYILLGEVDNLIYKAPYGCNFRGADAWQVKLNVGLTLEMKRAR